MQYNKTFALALLTLITLSVLNGCQQPSTQSVEKSVQNSSLNIKENKLQLGYQIQYEDNTKIEFALPENLSSTITLSGLAQTKLSENGESLTSFYAPINPLNSDEILFSTQAGTDDNISTNRIYSYNYKTGKLAELFKETQNRILRSIALDGNKLVLMNDGIDNSPHPCFSIWADWDSYSTLDLNNPSAGLQNYTMPDFQKEIGRNEQQNCLEEMGL